jgi:predicted secreted protein
MSVTTAIAIYFIIWWVVLFAVLPWGVRSQMENGEIAPGTDPGAPAVHGLVGKIGWTTLVSGAVFGLCYLVYVNRWVTLDELLTLWGVGG